MIDLSEYGVWLTENGTIIHELLINIKDEQTPIYFIRNYDYMTHTWNLITLNTSKNKAVSADMFNFTLSHSKSVYHVNDFCFCDINKAKEVLQIYLDNKVKQLNRHLKDRANNLVIGDNIAGINDIGYELSSNGCVIFKLHKIKAAQLRKIYHYSMTKLSIYDDYVLAIPTSNDWVFIKSGNIELLRDYAMH